MILEIVMSLLALMPQVAMAHENQRRLPGFFEDLHIQESVQEVFSTPMNEWDARQWITALILLFLILWCGGCVCQNRRRYYGFGGGGGGGCLQNVIMCACCYELCCRDCQDLQPFFGAKLPAEDGVSSPEYELHGGHLA